MSSQAERSTATSRYLRDVFKYPMLSAEEELTLARQWRERKDARAAHRLVNAHLRLVAKIAKNYRCYGLPIDELICEGNLGIMQAVQRFDPDRGFRFATYAVWWIRAAIQDHILRNRSLVKMGTTTAQKKLFYNLGRIKVEIAADNENDLDPDQVTKIASMLHVSKDDVVQMNSRLVASDQSLNAPVRGGSAGEWQDWLADDRDSPETVNADSQELAYRRILLSEALSTLKDRERHILSEHHLKDKPSSFGQLAQQYGISQERVRYIDGRAFAKLQKAMQAQSVRPRSVATNTAASRPSRVPQQIVRPSGHVGVAGRASYRPPLRSVQDRTTRSIVAWDRRMLAETSELVDG